MECQVWRIGLSTCSPLMAYADHLSSYSRTQSIYNPTFRFSCLFTRIAVWLTWVTRTTRTSLITSMKHDRKKLTPNLTVFHPLASANIELARDSRILPSTPRTLLGHPVSEFRFFNVSSSLGTPPFFLICPFNTFDTTRLRHQRSGIGTVADPSN